MRQYVQDMPALVLQAGVVLCVDRDVLDDDVTNLLTHLEEPLVAVNRGHDQAFYLAIDITRAGFILERSRHQAGQEMAVIEITQPGPVLV